MKTITPEAIIQLIIDKFGIDVREKNSAHDCVNFRSMYFYLSQRYCNYYSFLELANKVNSEYSTVGERIRNFLDRVNVKGYEKLNHDFNLLCSIIETEYAETPEFKRMLELQDFDLMKLQRLHKRSTESNVKLRGKIKQLERKIEKMSKNE